MDSRKAALLIWAQMACSDGKILDEEKQFLGEMAEALGITDPVEDILNEARASDPEVLYEHVSKYEDRVFVLLRSYVMARVDGRVDEEEEAMFVRMEERFEIKPEDSELIRKTAEDLENPESDTVDQRIEQYYKASSFVDAAG